MLHGCSALAAVIVSPLPLMTAPGPLRLMSNAAGITDKKEHGERLARRCGTS